MADKVTACRGGLLGLAVGDAMGRCVDIKSLEEICQDYGPNGLLGYDLANGSADVTACTQIAAFVGNGLLLGVSRGRKDLLPYITLSLREWARNQNFHRDPEKSHCWVAKPKCLRLHNNRDARMLDALRFETLGTPSAPRNTNTGAGAMPAAVALGLFYDPRRMDRQQLARLAVQTVALTHGTPEIFLAGAVLALSVADIVADPDGSMEEIFRNATETVCAMYGEQFPHPTQMLSARINQAIALSHDPAFRSRSGIERLGCNTGSACVAGAMYACLTCHGDFDAALITAVNHSGYSAAVGALTGALMGARMGADTLPEFYLESLEVRPYLDELAHDLALGGVTTGLFDDDWDHKYMQGLPLGRQQFWDV